MEKQTPSMIDPIAILAEALEPIAPPDGARQKLVLSLEGPGRYLPFCKELAGHFELPEVEMERLLALIDCPPRWKAGLPPLDGSLNFRPGPGLKPLHGGFFRLMGGGGFPLHRHRDRELTFVLSGRLKDDAGRLYLPGDFVDMPPGSTHSFGVPEGAPAVLAVLSGGIDVLGT